MKLIRNFNEDIQLVNLTEARRNPDLNPKISAYQALLPYKDNPNMYISFTKIDKIGINPKSDFNTPLGIYTYPLKEIWDTYGVDRKKSVGKAVPFAGNNPYIWLVERKPNVNFIDNMYSDYSSKDYDKDVKILKKYARKNISISDWYIMEGLFYSKYKKNPSSLSKTIDFSFTRWTEQAKERNAVMSMWNITRNLADLRRDKKPLVEWNVILRKVLGYDGFADKSGRGYIHPSEPIQAVFLHRGAFNVVAEFLNKDYSEDQDLPTWLNKASYDGKFVYEDGHVTFVSGKWKNGTWENGTWMTGVWVDGVWKHGSWRDGVWKSGTWQYGIWKDGKWINGVWEDGYWRDGVWKNGTWLDGTWIYGIWLDGVWEKGAWTEGLIYDPHKKGNSDSIFVVPSKEDMYFPDEDIAKLSLPGKQEDYFYSKLNPRDYFNKNYTGQ